MTCRRCGRQIAYVARLDAWGHSDRLPAGIFHYVPIPPPDAVSRRSDAPSDGGMDARPTGGVPRVRRSVLA